MRLSYYSIPLLCIAIFPACKKFVQINPPVTEIAGTEVYANNTSASAVMTGLYSNMMGSGGYLSDGTSSIGFLCGLSADELKNYYSSSPILSLYYTNSVNNTNTVFWTEIYNEIYTTNAVMEGLAKSSGVSVAMKRQLNGEAKFMRAFLHFYAVNLFGDVPLVTSTDYQTNNLIRRTSKSQVYQQIISDLKDAASALKNDYVDASGNSTSDRIRPNRTVAEALLARVYLYTGDWQNAKIQADSVISNTSNFSILSDLSQVFLANSVEAIPP